MPAVPDGNEVVVMLNATAGAMVMLRGAVAVDNWKSVTCTVKLEMPAPLGVPVIAPLFGSKCKPTGKLPAVTLQLYGVTPPVAASIAL